MTTLSRSLLVVIVLAVLSPRLAAQVSRGVVKEGLTLESKILGKPVRYTIYLLFDYETSERHYPVVYLLHGYTDNEANLIAGEAIANRTIPPMILVMPDGGVSFYINNHDNSVRYDDFFVQVFIPFIESIVAMTISSTKEMPPCTSCCAI